METPTPEQVAQMLAEIVQHSLMRGEPVYVPDLGTFYVDHRGSTTERLPDGRVVLHPPRDLPAFTPEAS